MRARTANSHVRSAFDQLERQTGKRRLLKEALRLNEERDVAFRRMILAIPAGKVATYGGVAAAAGYPRYHRAVAHLLRVEAVDQLPWHRVLGAGGVIKLKGEAAREQRARLIAEGVKFTGDRVEMTEYGYVIRPWDVYRSGD